MKREEKGTLKATDFKIITLRRVENTTQYLFVILRPGVKKTISNTSVNRNYDIKNGFLTTKLYRYIITLCISFSENVKIMLIYFCRILYIFVITQYLLMFLAIFDKFETV